MDRIVNQPAAADIGGVSPDRQASWNIIDPARADDLLGDNAPDWYALDKTFCATRVKQNALRRVYRVHIGDHAYYAKSYEQSGWRATLSRWFRGDPARREIRAAHYAQRHHVSAVTFCASSSGRDAQTRRRSLSISPAVTNVGTFTDVFDSATEQPNDAGHNRRRALIDACAKLVAAAHDAAFLHPDNHTGNILVQDGDGGVGCLYVDVYGARCGVAVSLSDAARNITPLAHWLSRRCSATGLLRGLLTYIEKRDLFATRDARNRWIRSVIHQTRVHAQRLYRKRDRRIGRSGAYFHRIELAGGWRAITTLRLRDVARDIGNQLPAADIANARTEIEQRIRDDFAVAVGPVLVDRSDTERFFSRRMIETWCWRWSNSALRRFKSSLAVMHRDLPCAMGWSYLEQRDGSWIRQVAWIRLTPPNCTPIGQWLASDRAAPHRRLVLDQIGQLLADTLDRGLVPRNLFDAPLAVQDDGGNKPRVIWNGIEATVVAKSARPSARRFVLEQFARATDGLSVRQVARGLRAYCRRSRRDNWKRVWREMADGMLVWR